MTKQRTFDVAVVGLGLIGAAALRYLADAGAPVAGIGPPEPTDWSRHPGAFASHYDSGRITRILDERLEWAELARRSIAAHPLLTRRSGIEFHRPVGVLHVTPDDAVVRRTEAVGRALGVDFEIGPAAEQGSAPYRVPPHFTALAEHGGAGHIDPRAMLRAQLTAATAAGAAVLPTEVRWIDERPGAVEIGLADGSGVVARKVLVAAGAYTGTLLPGLEFTIKTETTILARVEPAKAHELGNVPALLYDIDHAEADEVYVVPPVLYPNGHHYLKMGCNLPGDRYLAGPSEMSAWMQGEDVNEHQPLMVEVLRRFLPEVRIAEFVMKPCLVAYTEHGLPYIDRVADRVYVAAGGNGSAAKSSDALGAVAAALVRTGDWTDPLPAGAFRAA